MSLSFLNPAYLYALPLALGPLALHLFFRKNPGRVPFSDLRFIRKALEKMQARMRLRQYLLLIVRTLLVIFVIMYFARPLWRSAGNAAGPGGSAHPALVLLVDVSYSMGYTEDGVTRFERFRERARKIIERLPADTRIGVVAYSDRVEAATQHLTSDKQLVGAFLDGLTLSSRPTNIASAWPVLQRLAGRDGAGITAVVLSDAARHGFRSPLPQTDAAMRVIVFEPEKSSNIWVDSVDAVFDEGREEWNFTARIGQAFEAQPATWPVAWHLDGKKVSGEYVALAGSPVTHSCRYPSREAGVSGRVELFSDRLAADNGYYVAARRPEPVRIWIIDGDPRFGGVSSESFYLRSVFPRAEVIPESEADTAAFGAPGLIIAANLRSPHASIERFVASGGSLIAFLGDHFSDESFPAYLPAEIGQQFTQAATVNWQENGHDVFQKLKGGEFDWGKILVQQGYFLKEKDDARTLARLSSGWPYLIEGRFGQGKVILCCSTADREWSNAAGKPIFAPLLHQFVYYLTEGNGSAEIANIRVGEQYRRDKCEACTIITPSGREMKPAAEDRSIVFNATDEPGIYQVRSFGQDSGRFAVNVDASSGESDLKPLGIFAARRYFPGTVIAIPVKNWEKEFMSAVAGTDIARLMLFGVLLMMLAEAILSGGGQKAVRRA